MPDEPLLQATTEIGTVIESRTLAPAAERTRFPAAR
jgi:hypothetical protein